jgi:hypothetical protein
VGHNRGPQGLTIVLTIASLAVDAQGRPCFALDDLSARYLEPSTTVIVLSADGTNLLSSAAFNSFVENVALDGSGGLYVAGNTIRLAFFATPGAYQALHPGGTKLRLRR